MSLAKIKKILLKKTSIHMLNAVDNVRDIKLPLLLNRLLKKMQISGLGILKIRQPYQKYEQKRIFTVLMPFPIVSIGKLV